MKYMIIAAMLLATTTVKGQDWVQREPYPPDTVKAYIMISNQDSKCPGCASVRVLTGYVVSVESLVPTKVENGVWMPSYIRTDYVYLFSSKTEIKNPWIVWDWKKRD